MRPRRTLLALLFLGSITPAPSGSQEAAKSYGSLDELKASYAKQLLELDRRRLSDMAALAAKQTGEEAEATYRELFQIAFARDLYTEAEPAAKRFLRGESKDPVERARASLVLVIAMANRGEYDQSLAALTEYARQNPAPDAGGTPVVDGATVAAVGEVYVQRLIRAGRYDIARKVCELIVARRHEPEVKAQFSARLARMNMVGKPAPAISGRDVDGKLVQLADLKGKVVLVDFWATWCPPCVAMFPELQTLQAKYGKDGFAILGVNLDARHQDVKDVAKAAPIVREFLLNSRATWPSILVGPPAAGDPAAAFGVEEIPASFLIDRSGKIIQIEQSGPELEKAVRAAVSSK